MKLSVIIVNYNVKYFLEQALHSVEKAAKGLSIEVWVVDNNSSDGSVEMIKSRYPHEVSGKQSPSVFLIENKENIGFSKANNQAIRQSKGEYVLLLNPDTVVSEDTFQKCLDFMDAHPDAGGLGVKTIDGSGTFLPESKRGFPSPWVAFCKAFGSSAIFPKSAFFNQYYLGHLSNDETHEVGVLVGSYMLLRRSVLDKIGLLDEAFFMYGEDIDLSYRIVNQGFKNYYFPNTTIIHYKGESTKKGSFNYIRIFYGAMIIFAQKHFQGQKAVFYIGLMKIAVWFRAILTLLSNIFKKINLLIFDAILIFIGLYLLKDFWSNYYFKDTDYIKSDFLYFNTPLYIIIWLSTIYFSGGYDKPLSARRILRGVVVGTILLSAVYGFLDLTLRSSRMLIVLGALWTSMSIITLRFIIGFIKNKNFKFDTVHRDSFGEGGGNVLVVGSEDESERVKTLLSKAQVFRNLLGFVNDFDTQRGENYLGKIEDLDFLIKTFNIKEIIFCSKDIDYQWIINTMARLKGKLDFKILPDGSDSIIGSSNKNTSGELYTMDTHYNISSPMNRRNKRVLDISLSILFLILSPILIFIKPLILKKILAVLIGHKTWVGYNENIENNLPKIKKGVFTPLVTPSQGIDNQVIRKLNFLYAKDYTIWDDVKIIYKSIIK